MEPRTSGDPLGISRHIRKPGPAPVHLWDPPYCGEMDMRIARDGTWYHEGTPIRREALVQLFSSVLKKEGDRHYLVTPVEKVGIQVEDCPFVARTVSVDTADGDQQVRFILNTGEELTADAEHPIEVGLTHSEETNADEPHPTVHVRNGLLALLSRNVFYELVERAEHRSGPQGTVLVIRSAGSQFELGSYQSPR